MLDAGYWILDTGCWILDAGLCKAVSGPRLSDRHLKTEAREMSRYTRNPRHLSVALRLLSVRIASQKSEIKKTLSLVFCILWLCATASSQAVTLEPRAGTRPLGMSAFAAVADDINAIAWNPAGLSLLQNQEATASYAPVFGFDTGINQSHLAYAYPSGRWGTIGIDLTYLDYGDMDWRDREGNLIEGGVFTRNDYSIYLSYGLRLVEFLSLGASIGSTSIKTELTNDLPAGVGLDLGMLYTIASRISFGLHLENIGGVSVSKNEIARQKIRGGAALSILNTPTMGFVLAMDLDEQQGKLDTFYSGIEWSIFSPSSFFVKRKIQERYAALMRYEGMADYTEGLPEQKGKASLCIRGGVRKRLAVDEPTSFSGGVCIKYLIVPESLALRIEHAFAWHPFLEATHRFSLGLEMGQMAYR